MRMMNTTESKAVDEDQNPKKEQLLTLHPAQIVHKVNKVVDVNSDSFR